MKTIRIDTKTKLSHVENPTVADGLGGVHAHGAVVELPDETAAALVSLGFGDYVDATIKAKAVQQATEDAAARMQAQRQAAARHNMEIWDSLPPGVRARAREDGDSVIEDYLAGLPSVPLDEYEKSDVDVFRPEIGEETPAPAPRRRGRPPKVRPPVPEGGDVH